MELKEAKKRDGKQPREVKRALLNVPAFIKLWIDTLCKIYTRVEGYTSEKFAKEDK